MKRIVLLTILLLSTCLSFAQSRWGIVNLSSIALRAEPDYEAPLETECLMGSVLEILDSEGIWLKVRSVDPPYTAWTAYMGVSEKSRQEIDQYLSSERFICTSEYSYVYSEATSRSSRICDLVMGDRLEAIMGPKGKPQSKGVFYKVKTPSGQTGYVKKLDLALFEEWALSRAFTAGNVITQASKMLGTPYMWGGNTVKHADCSGLTWLAFYMNGILLPRNVSQQIKIGQSIPLDKLQPGDLLFFGKPATEQTPESIGHVGIYMGGQKFIHSSMQVRINSLNPEDKDYYDSNTLLYARRLIGQEEYDSGVISIKNNEHYFLNN